ncbi:MAG: hypothetical protein EXR75_02185 [Myxococcales bacterium]|nr:hypothetical protein [Myxococcales bacterium]
MRVAIGALALVVASGCEGESKPGVVRPTVSSLVAAENPTSPWLRARARAGLDYVVLAVDGDDAVCARPLPPSATEHQRAMHGVPAFVGLRLASHDRLVTHHTVIDAALDADRARVVFVTEGRELYVRDAQAAARRLDSDVAPGLSLSADGARVAYAKGTAPELDVFVAQLDGDVVTALAPHPAADYLPAFAPNGDVIITSSRDGQPGLWRVDARGTVTRVSARVADGDVAGLRRLVTPDGREPPAVGPHAIAFFDGAGVAVVRNGELLGRIEGAQRFAWLDGHELALERDGTALILRIEEGR